MPITKHIQKVIIDSDNNTIRFNEHGLLESENCSEEFLNLINFTRPWLSVNSGTSYGLLSHLCLDDHLLESGRFVSSLQFIIQNTDNYCFMGTLESIGGELITPDWDTAEGHLVLLSCEGENWFTIKNNGTPIGTTKKILTGKGEDIDFVSKALFSYSGELEAYILLSYETKILWHKRFYWSEIPEGEPDIDGYYTFVTDIGVPFNNCWYWGYARLPFEATRLTQCHDNNVIKPGGGNSILTFAQYLGGSEEVLAQADKGWCHLVYTLEQGIVSCDADIGVTEVKGGARIFVTGAECADRRLQLRFKPQDTLTNIDFDNMRLDVWLLGNKDGHACYDS